MHEKQTTLGSFVVREMISIGAAFKSVNLQYNTLVRWFPWTIVSATECLMFQVLFTLGH